MVRVESSTQKYTSRMLRCLGNPQHRLIVPILIILAALQLQDTHLTALGFPIIHNNRQLQLQQQRSGPTSVSSSALKKPPRSTTTRRGDYQEMMSKINRNEPLLLKMTGSDETNAATPSPPCILKVLCVGGGGGNAVNRMIQSEIEGLSFWSWPNHYHPMCWILVAPRHGGWVQVEFQKLAAKRPRKIPKKYIGFVKVRMSRVVSHQPRRATD